MALNITFQVVLMENGSASYEAKWQDTCTKFETAAEVWAQKLGEHQSKEVEPPRILDRCCYEDDFITLWVQKVQTPVNNTLIN